MNNRLGDSMSKFKAESLEIANSIDTQICNILSKKNNFRVEAGAGSGKTY